MKISSWVDFQFSWVWWLSTMIISHFQNENTQHPHYIEKMFLKALDTELKVTEFVPAGSWHLHNKEFSFLYRVLRTTIFPRCSLGFLKKMFTNVLAKYNGYTFFEPSGRRTYCMIVSERMWSVLPNSSAVGCYLKDFNVNAQWMNVHTTHNVKSIWKWCPKYAYLMTHSVMKYDVIF